MLQFATPGIMPLRWEKVLFIKQDYPDNYVEPTLFLKELRKNLNSPTYTCFNLINSSQQIIRPFTLVCLFLCSYFYLIFEWIKPHVLLYVNAVILFLFPLMCTKEMPYSFVFPSVFLHFFLCGVAPILCTLTQAISSDTLWAMTVGMLFFHLIFYNYKNKQALYECLVT